MWKGLPEGAIPRVTHRSTTRIELCLFDGHFEEEVGQQPLSFTYGG